MARFNHQLPLISVVMPTLNSAKTIEKSLQSIRAQDYPQDQIEILLADGGSTDATLEIAARYQATVLKNERVQPECGKQVGLLAAKGKYVVFLDSDEEMRRPDAFRRKAEFLGSEQAAVKNFVTAGLTNPPGFADINDYTNRYGEPFSGYMYGIDGGDYYPSLQRLYPVALKTDDVLVVEFRPNDILPIVDGGGHFFDREFLLKLADPSDLNVIPNVFSLMVDQTHQLAALKGDYINHYSTVSLAKYLQKIRWRIVTNLFYADQVGAGFQEKQRHQPTWFKLKKYLFIPYALTLIGPTVKSLQLWSRHRKAVYLLHLPLTVWTAALILYFTAAKAFGAKPSLTTYAKK